MATLVLGAAGAALGGASAARSSASRPPPSAAPIGSAIGSVIDSGSSSSLAPDQRIEGAAARQPARHLLDRGRGDPAPLRAHAPRRQHHLGDRLPRGDQDHEPGRRQGRRRREVKTTEYRYFASFAVALCEGPIAGIGRIWADGKPFDVPGDLALVSGRRDAAARSAHRGDDGRGGDAGLSRHRLRRLRGPAARRASATACRSSPSRSSARSPIPTPPRGWCARSTSSRPRASSSTRPSRSARTRRRRDRRREPQRRCRQRRHRGLARPARGDGAGGRERQPGRRLVRRRPARRRLPDPAGRRGRRQDDDAARAGRSTASPAPMPIWSARDAEGRPVYGGTPADFAVVQAIQEMKARGLRVTFYPFILMDVPAGNAPAEPLQRQRRGDRPAGLPLARAHHLLAGGGLRRHRRQDRRRGRAGRRLLRRGAGLATSRSRARASAWTGPAGDWGLRRMILHYAHLCAAAGGVDAFLIGSEMRGLTHVRSGAAQLSGGAGVPRSRRRRPRDPRAATTKISYAADWSEYFGHQPRTARATSSSTSTRSGPTPNIDFVGIDNYMPLSDWRDGCEHARRAGGLAARSTTAPICRRTSRAARASTGSTPAPPIARRRSARRSPTAPPASRGCSATRICEPGGRTSTSTARAASRAARPPPGCRSAKPIRFTEPGCPAVDSGTNQPNVFFDPKSSESFLPYFSRGWRDDAIQRAYLEALYLYWGEPANNPASGGLWRAA